MVRFPDEPIILWPHNSATTAIRGFVESPAISPRFVRRVLEEYGDESAKAAFLLRGDLPGRWLDCKGRYFRKRYTG
jgi:hypothetical protein